MLANPSLRLTAQRNPGQCGAEQLVQSFFSELSAQLKLKPGLAEVGKGLEEYGDIFSNLT